MNITVRDIVLAVRYGDAALAGESAGYLILGAADLCLIQPQFVTLDSVSLTPQGSLQIDGFACGPDDAEDALRALLGQLLAQVRGPAPNLHRISERVERRGVGGLVQELEAALIPVNRCAAGRTLARLVREATKSAAQERSFARVEQVPVSRSAQAPAHSPSFSSEVESVSLPVGKLAPVAEFAEFAPPSKAEPLWPAVEIAAPSQRYIDTSRVIVSTTELPPSRSSHRHTGGAKCPVSLAAVAHAFSAETSFGDPLETEPVDLEEADFFSDDEFDEAPTQVFEGSLEWTPPRIMTPLPVPVDPVKTRFARRGPPKVRFLQAVRRAKQPIGDNESLVPLDIKARVLPRSEISDLLDRMKISELPMDEVYTGLKNLIQLEMSPRTPCVAEREVG